MRNTLLKIGAIVVAEKEGQADVDWRVIGRSTSKSGKTQTVSLVNINTGDYVGNVKVLSDIDEIDGNDQLVEWVNGKKLGAELAYVK